jgi:putative ABC transport system permease protein
MGIGLPKARYGGADEQISFYDRVRTALEAIPGVESASIVNSIPGGRTLKVGYELAGEDANGDRLSAIVIGPKYFDTLAAPVLAGRDFTDSDGPESAVTIVNQRFANQHWPGESSLGKRLRLLEGKTSAPWLTVVGLAPNIAQDGIFSQNPTVYVSYRQRPAAGMDVIARTRVAPASLIAAFRRVLQKMDPELPVFGPLTLDARLESSYWTPGIDGALFAVLGFVALLLAGTGLYAVIAHSVSRRTQEIGIRMAIGGTAGDIRTLVIRQGMLPLAIGLAIGLGASFAVNRALQSLLVHVAPADPIAFGVTSVVLIAAGLMGCWIPARRAMRVDPVVALRHE